jgi:hypothetical protein
MTINKKSHMKKIAVILFLVLVAGEAIAQSKTSTENIILITLDGMRWQEVFGGAEKRLMMNKKFVRDSVAAKRLFWAETSEERRKKLMPFIWSTIASQGQLYGNRNKGSKVNTENTMWFSYPGYNEILTGFADDARINSNDPNDNPNRNVLEFINAQKGFTGKVAAFTSWETFPWIINTKRNGIPVNSGLMKAGQNPSECEQLLNELMFQIPDISGETRLDGLTFQYSMAYLKKTHPRVLFISFDETDHFAHEGEYDKYLASAHYTDGFIESLWSWLQSQTQYRNKTTMIITTDHGRGNTNEEDWRHHGSKMEDADQIWLAVIGPDSPALGESVAEGQLFQAQIAGTMAALLGMNYQNEHPTGEIIKGVFNKK